MSIPNTAKADTVARRASIQELSDEEAEVLIDGIRERRLKAFNVFQEAKAEQDKLKQKKGIEAYSRQLTMFTKELAAADKAIDKLESRVLKLRALKLSWSNDYE